MKVRKKFKHRLGVVSALQKFGKDLKLQDSLFPQECKLGVLSFHLSVVVLHR